MTDEAPVNRDEAMRQRRARFPSLRSSLAADARLAAHHRFERQEFRSTLDLCVQIARLMLVSDAFVGQVLYRLRTRLQARGVPVLPHLLHRATIASSQIAIGDPVLVHPGVYVIHGQVVVDGLTEIGSGTVIGPFVTIGLAAHSLEGPTIRENVFVGTGSRILGPVEIGAGATIGANAVVVRDVAAGDTVVGVPAKPLRRAKQASA